MTIIVKKKKIKVLKKIEKKSDWDNDNTISVGNDGYDKSWTTGRKNAKVIDLSAQAPSSPAISKNNRISAHPVKIEPSAGSTGNRTSMGRNGKN